MLFHISLNTLLSLQMWSLVFSIAPIWKVFLNLIAIKSIEQDPQEHLFLYKTTAPSGLCVWSFISRKFYLTHLQASQLLYLSFYSILIHYPLSFFVSTKMNRIFSFLE